LGDAVAAYRRYVTPIDHVALPARLEAAGFRFISVDKKFRMFRFRAIAGV